MIDHIKLNEPDEIVNKRISVEMNSYYMDDDCNEIIIERFFIILAQICYFLLECK